MSRRQTIEENYSLRAQLDMVQSENAILRRESDILRRELGNQAILMSIEVERLTGLEPTLVEALQRSRRDVESRGHKWDVADVLAALREVYA